MFLRKLFAADNGDRSPWGNFWFEPVGMRTSAGVAVNADNAMQISAVFGCVRIISQQFASLPFKLYRNKAGGGKELVTDHPLLSLFRKKPNPYQNAFEWREMMTGHLALRGNAFNEIVSDKQGNITALMPLHPDRMKIDLLPGGNYRYKYTDHFGNMIYYPRGQIWHLRGLSSDGIVGMSPLAMARVSIGGALAAQDYGSRFFANDAKPTGGWIESPHTFKTSTEREQFREKFQEQQGNFNRGKMAVLEYGMKYHEVGVTNEDAQFLETRKFLITDIARWFGVPPHKIGDLDRATFSNIEQQAQEFIQECLGPMAERWETSIEAELLFDDEGIEVEFDFAQLLRGDSQARAAYYTSGINTGWLTRNEARARENLNPLKGLDKPLVPLNMSEEGALKPVVAPKPSGRLAGILEVNARRLARRFVKSGISADDAHVVAESMGIASDSAIDFCNAFATHADDEDLIVAGLLQISEEGN